MFKIFFNPSMWIFLPCEHIDFIALKYIKTFSKIHLYRIIPDLIFATFFHFGYHKFS